MEMNKKELYTKAFKKLVECGEIDKYTTKFAVMYNPKTDIMDVIVYTEDFGETEEYGKEIAKDESEGFFQILTGDEYDAEYVRNVWEDGLDYDENLKAFLEEKGVD